jgi:predicted negative regulator of RcsB-dependent stress response
MTAPVTSGTSAPTVEQDWATWGRENARKLLITGGVLVGLVGGGWLYLSSEQRKESFASQALANARSSAEAGNLPLAARDLASVVQRFGGTKSADAAFILLSQVRLFQGQRDTAVAGLQQFVRSRHPDYVKASAYGLLGGGLEDQNKQREAGDAYRQAAAAAPLDFLKAEYLIDAGRALAAGGDTTGARAALAEVLEKYAELDQAAEARVRMAEIGGTVPPPPTPRRTPAGRRPAAG